MLFSTLPTSLALLISTTLLPQTYAYKPLSDSFLRAIPSPGASIDPSTGALLSPLLIPRVPGTPGQTAAQAHFASFFTTQLPNWSLTWQNSTSRTPISGGAELPFANLIFRREPPWVKPGQANYLTLAAHYDSKYLPGAERGFGTDSKFVGATDSAASCAMLMYVAEVLEPHVSRMYKEMEELGEGGSVEMDMGVQILLLDGEEAFGKWTDDDSLYGSRALAQQWTLTPNPPSAKFYKYRNPLQQISLFMLLDLLGAPNPNVPSYFPTTHWAYKHLSSIESRMRDLSLLESVPDHPFLPYSDVSTRAARGGISDDHLPFMGGGVEILHVIPQPFPDVWHTLADTGENLDMATVRDWARIVAAFALEWLDMMEVWDEPDGEGTAERS